MNKIKAQKKSIIFSNYSQFVIACDNLRKIENLPLPTIQRSVSPYCKTSLLGNSLSLKIKGFPFFIAVRLLPNDDNFSINYYRTILDNNDEKFIDISASNLNELMYKINHIYKLTYPKFLCQI